MYNLIPKLVLLFAALSLTVFSCRKEGKEPIGEKKDFAEAETQLTLKQTLGKRIFFDDSLSTPSGQACAECHSPKAAFANDKAELPVSQGVHKDRFGGRNDLSAAYAGFSPTFHYDSISGGYIGGYFWDGRAADLAAQAQGPFLNPLEMANPDKRSVIEKIRRSEYAELFQQVFGTESLQDDDKAYDFVAEAIADYERSAELNKFNSKYDLYLKGEVSLSEKEKRGLDLFNGPGMCANCHPSEKAPSGEHPLFTDYTYDNLGLPKNPENPFYYLSKELNPEGISSIDLGLGGVLKKPEENGKFRVPSLRNVALTTPYMHNGIFKTLNQVVMFYNTRDVGHWPEPEVAANINHAEMGNLGLSQLEVNDIVAFLCTLSDDYKPER